MLEWSIAAAVGAWIVLCAALLVAITYAVRFIRRSELAVQRMEEQVSLLVNQATDLTNRGDQVLERVQGATDELVKWRETAEQTRTIAATWSSALSAWSRRTQAAVEMAQQNNERRIQETLQWVDIGYALWQDVTERRRRATHQAQSSSSAGSESS